MPQRLKEDLRTKILVAAGEVFAESGYPAARLAEIAKRAGTSTSNLYKYFENKSALFEQSVPADAVALFVSRLRERVGEFRGRPDWTQATASGSKQAGALLDYWISHRHITIFLLINAQGSPYASIREELVETMVSEAVAWHVDTSGTVDPSLRFIVVQVFTRTLEIIANILRTYREETSIRETIAHFWRYQLAGLEALLQSRG